MAFEVERLKSQVSLQRLAKRFCTLPSDVVAVEIEIAQRGVGLQSAREALSAL